MPALTSRTYPRIDSDIPAQCLSDRRKLVARILNLGGGGVFLDLPHGGNSESELSVLFRPARRSQAVKARIVARHLHPGVGAGFEFTQIAPSDREGILRLVLSGCAKGDKSRASLVAQVQHAGATFLAFSRLINSAGMFLETREALPEGTNVLVRFRLAEDEQVLALNAQIAYEIKRSGLGINWVGLASRDRERLDAYIEGRPAPSGWALDRKKEPGIFGVS